MLRANHDFIGISDERLLELGARREQMLEDALRDHKSVASIQYLTRKVREINREIDRRTDASA